PGASLVPGGAQPNHQYRDRHQWLRRPLLGARRSRRPRRLGGAGVLQPAGSVDMVRCRARRPRRPRFAERPAPAHAPAGGPSCGRNCRATDGPRMILRLLFAALLLVTLGETPAKAVEPSERLADPALEARARALSKELRCLVCRNQSVDDSNADL